MSAANGDIIHTHYIATTIRYLYSNPEHSPQRVSVEPPTEQFNHVYEGEILVNCPVILLSCHNNTKYPTSIPYLALQTFNLASTSWHFNWLTPLSRCVRTNVPCSIHISPIQLSTTPGVTCVGSRTTFIWRFPNLRLWIQWLYIVMWGDTDVFNYLKVYYAHVS